MENTKIPKPASKLAPRMLTIPKPQIKTSTDPKSIPVPVKPTTVPKPLPAPTTTVPKPLPAPTTTVPKPLPAPTTTVPKPLPAPTTTTQKPLPTVSKSGLKPLPTTKTITKDTSRFLRRRSKSVADLRPKVTEKLPLHRLGQKRLGPPLKDNENTKPPKVPKLPRIPEWDYKARFGELQKKYASVLEDKKQLLSKVEDYVKLEEEVVGLREENTVFRSQLECLKEENHRLSNERNQLHQKCADIEIKYNEKNSMCMNLEKQTKELEEKSRIFETQLNSITAERNTLKSKNEEMEVAIADLKCWIEENEQLRRSLHNTIQDLKGNIRVFCRVRPPASSEEHDKLLCSIFTPNESTLEIRKSRESVSITGRPTDLRQEFTFDRVFPAEARQVEVFEELAQLVQSALDGYDVCVFAYGQTGSGKTFTMQGTPNDRGMIPRTIDLIFDKTQKLSKSDWDYKISVSILEIYNENIRDLLVPNSSQNYELRYNEGRGVTVTNLKIIEVKASQEIQELMEEAQRNRAVAATDFNEHSSRSHAVTKIYLEGYNHETKVKYEGSVNLVDLAGSESAKTTTLERLTETKNINKSLATLGNVMLALHNKDSHVPYRNSKLTFLLQSCLGGNSKTLMIVNISPFEECFSESVNSLRFAAKVKEVKMTAKKNKTYECR